MHTNLYGDIYSEKRAKILKQMRGQDREMKWARIAFWILMVGGILVILSEVFITPRI